MNNFYFKLAAAIYIVFFSNFLFCQDIKINEIVASNSTNYEDNDTPDWIELYNYGTEVISLSGMTLSDDDNEPQKWTFGEVSLAPGQYLLVWASGKDKVTSFYNSVVKRGDEFSYHIPIEPVRNQLFSVWRIYWRRGN